MHIMQLNCCPFLLDRGSIYTSMRPSYLPTRVFLKNTFSLGHAESRLSGNLQCKSPSFFTKWFDLLDLSYRKKLLDMLCIDPRGVREGIALIFF